MSLFYITGVEIDRCGNADEQGVPAIGEFPKLHLRRCSREQGWDHQGTIHSQGHPPDRRELGNGCWQDFLL